MFRWASETNLGRSLRRSIDEAAGDERCLRAQSDSGCDPEKPSRGITIKPGTLTSMCARKKCVRYKRCSLKRRTDGVAATDGSTAAPGIATTSSYLQQRARGAATRAISAPAPVHLSNAIVMLSDLDISLALHAGADALTAMPPEPFCWRNRRAQCSPQWFIVLYYSRRLPGILLWN